MQPTYYEIDFLDGTSKAFSSEEEIHEYAKEKQIVAYAVITNYQERKEFKN